MSNVLFLFLFLLFFFRLVWLNLHETFFFSSILQLYCYVTLSNENLSMIFTFNFHINVCLFIEFFTHKSTKNEMAKKRKQMKKFAHNSILMFYSLNIEWKKYISKCVVYACFNISCSNTHECNVGVRVYSCIMLDIEADTHSPCDLSMCVHSALF